MALGDISLKQINKTKRIIKIKKLPGHSKNMICNAENKQWGAVSTNAEAGTFQTQTNSYTTQSLRARASRAEFVRAFR